MLLGLHIYSLSFSNELKLFHKQQDFVQCPIFYCSKKCPPDLPVSNYNKVKSIIVNADIGNTHGLEKFTN